MTHDCSVIAKLETTALYTHVATNTIREVMSPLERLTPLRPRRTSRPPDARRACAPGAGGRGYLPRPWPGVASSQCRPCEPRPAEGHVGDRELPHGGSRRARRALRGQCAHTLIAYNSCRNRHCPKCQGAARARSGWPSARPSCCRCRTSTWCSRCRREIADIAYQNKAVIYDLLFKASAETLLTIAADPKHLGARIGFTAVLHTWGSALTHHPHVHMIVPGGGISLDGKRWIACRPGYLPAGARCSRAVPPAVPGEAARRRTTPATCSSSAIMPTLTDQSASRPIWRRCARPNGSSTPSGRSPDPRQVLAYLVALHPPRRHLQPPADRLRRQRRHLQVQGLPDRGPRPLQDDDARAPTSSSAAS